jgi:hypothetical protein
MSAGVPTLAIPASLADLLLSVQPRIRELTQEAQKRSIFWRVLHAKTAIVESRVPLGPELRFWEIDADEALESFLFSKLLAVLPPHVSSIDFDTLPHGYRPLLDVLEFERHRQFEGWTAATNHGPERLNAISRSYAEVGLPDEAAALEKVANVLSEVVEITDDTDNALEDAYCSVRNRTPTIEERLPVILSFVRANPMAFGEA